MPFRCFVFSPGVIAWRKDEKKSCKKTKLRKKNHQAKDKITKKRHAKTRNYEKRPGEKTPGEEADKENLPDFTLVILNRNYCFYGSENQNSHLNAIYPSSVSHMYIVQKFLFLGDLEKQNPSRMLIHKVHAQLVIFYRSKLLLFFFLIYKTYSCIVTPECQFSRYS